MRTFFALQLTLFPEDAVSLSVGLRPCTTVPSNAGLKILRTYTGMLSSIHGTMAEGSEKEKSNSLEIIKRSIGGQQIQR